MITWGLGDVLTKKLVENIRKEIKNLILTQTRVDRCTSITKNRFNVIKEKADVKLRRKYSQKLDITSYTTIFHYIVQK